MALSHSPKIVTNNLVLYYDMYNTKKSFLGEPTTNLITASEDFSDASWGKANFTVNTNATLAPNNTLTADAIIATTNDPWMVYSATVTAGTTYTWSIYIKGSPGVVGKYGYIWIWHDGSVDGLDVGTAYTLTSNWQRVSITYIADSSGTLSLRLDPGEQFGANPSATGDIYYLWGAQFEAKSYATPFVNGTRTNTQALLDLTGSKTITVSSLTYNIDGTFSFNGSSDYISAGNLGTFPTNGTIDFWMYSTEVVSYRNPFHTNFTGSPNNIGIRFEQVTGGQLGVVIGNDAATYAGYVLTTSLQSNTWYNVVVTWNTATSTATGYLNAVQGFTTSSHTYWATTLSNVVIGSGFSDSRRFKGDISSVKIYNKTLSPEEVKQNFEVGSIRFGI